MKVAKELGDVLWYVSAIAKSLDIPLSAIAELNIAKLSHRHSGVYTHSTSADRHAREDRFEDTVHFLALRNIIMGDVTDGE